jgi:hypothetical protein
VRVVNLGRLCRCGHRYEAHDHWRRGTECVICGQPGCAQFRWRWWPWALTLAALAVTALLVFGLTACSSPAATTTPAPRPSPARYTGCTWYSPVGKAGQQVIVSITGPACTGPTPALVQWIAIHTDRMWISSGARIQGTELADVGRAGSVVRVWFTGPPGGPAGPVAGQLADDLAAAGWSAAPGSA